ncbi:MAG: redoxin domain-containing protein [Ignavibacteriales bacterium]|nr:redoxin domain-containing protein [Ignavibacteriales bacterium]
MELQPKHVRAPVVYGDFWFNTDPISLSSLQGNSVVLIDFWDYSCISCIRALPYIKEWHRKYKDFGLVVIGVHTPEFKFARTQEVIQRALRELSVLYPVVADNEAIVWSAYGVRVWPTRVLIDVDGYIRIIQNGESGYQEFERAIQQLLAEAGYHGEMPELTKPFRDTDEPGVALFQTTREIHLGYLKGTLGNPEGFSAEATAAYVDKGLHLPERFYANGKWMSERDFLCFNGAPGEQGIVTFQYDAREVNAVMNSKIGSRFEIVVQQDDNALTESNAGLDVVLLPEKSVVRVDTPKMYRLVKNPEFQTHTLKLIVSDPNVEIYAFSFVSSVIPDVIPSN